VLSDADGGNCMTHYTLVCDFACERARA